MLVPSKQIMNVVIGHTRWCCLYIEGCHSHCIIYTELSLVFTISSGLDNERCYTITGYAYLELCFYFAEVSTFLTIKLKCPSSSHWPRMSFTFEVFTMHHLGADCIQIKRPMAIVTRLARFLMQTPPESNPKSTNNNTLKADSEVVWARVIRWMKLQ